MSVDVQWVTLQRAGEPLGLSGTQEKVGLSEAVGQGECCRSGDSFPGTGAAWSLGTQCCIRIAAGWVGATSAPSSPRDGLGSHREPQLRVPEQL